MSALWTRPPVGDRDFDAEALAMIGWPWGWPAVPASVVRGTMTYALARVHLAGRAFIRCLRRELFWWWLPQDNKETSR